MTFDKFYQNNINIRKILRLLGFIHTNYAIKLEKSHFGVDFGGHFGSEKGTQFPTILTCWGPIWANRGQNWRSVFGGVPP